MTANHPVFHLPAPRLPELRYDHATALALAVTGNFLLLLMLSLPRDDGDFAVVLPAADPPPITAELITRAQPETIPPPPMPTPPTPKPRPVLQTIVDAPILPIPVETVEPVPTESTAAPQIAATATATSAPAGPPMERGAGVSYGDAPPPRYPGASIRRSDEGTVMLRVLVGVDGRARKVDIAHTSGHTELDRVAQRQVLERWRFIPALREGREVEAWVMVPVEFKLSRR